MRLSIGIPSNRDWKPLFCMSLIGLITGHGCDFLRDLAIIPNDHGLLVKQRRLIVQKAIDNGSTHLLFIDDDMIFPPSTLRMLARHGQSFVAANYTARKTGGPTAVTLLDERCFSKGRTDLEEVSRCGFGVVLLELAKVKELPQPWFSHPWIVRNGVEIGEEMGEDFYFCHQWRHAGHKVFIDHELSNQVEHIGEQILAVS